jgi:CDGSH-type Zn-finger protein
MSEPSVHLTVIDNGPLKVENAGKIAFGAEVHEVDGAVWLCRCGESSNAPFCDGSHQKAGFEGTCAQPGEQACKTWEGQRIRTRFNPTACMHVFYCKPLKELRARELAEDGPAGVEAAREIARVVSTCPSGALSYELKTPIEVNEAPQEGPVVEVMEGGEIRIKCAFTGIEPLEGIGARATLCRCGLSKNKPYCDGRHKRRKDWR